MGSRHDQKPNRPRHNLEQLVATLDHAWQVDPRHLATMCIGVGQGIAMVVEAG